MAAYRYCEFGHLMTPLVVPGHEDLSTWGHVDERDALVCAYFVNLGWPDARLEVS